MKRIKLIPFLSVFILVFLFIIPQETSAQGPPPWAPAHGYRAKTRHIYFPEHNFYFDVQKRCYIYLNNGKWSVSVSIPTPFASINLSKSTQIELDLASDKPYIHNEIHKVKYKKPKKKKKVKVVHVEHENEGHGHGHGHGKGKKK